MCRIGSLFLLQSRKEACKATRDFNNIETRAAIKFFFPARQGAEGNSHHSDRNIRGICTILCHRQNWVALFKRGCFSTYNAPRPGRPKTGTTPELIDQIHEIILEDRRISATSIPDQLGISRERVGSIIHEDLVMRKLSAKWVPKCLSADKKLQRCQSSEQPLEFFRSDPNDFLSQLVTMDETWLYHYDPEAKQQSMEWRHTGSPRPKKFLVQKSAGKFLASIFWDQDGIILIDCLHKGQTINAEYYSSLLVQLKDILKEKRHGAGRSPRGSCSCTAITRLTGHLQPRRNWPTWASNVLITHPFSGSVPVGLPPVPWTEKTNERSPFFVRRRGHWCRGDLVGRTNFQIFCEWLTKVRAMG